MTVIMSRSFLLLLVATSTCLVTGFQAQSLTLTRKNLSLSKTALLQSESSNNEVTRRKALIASTAAAATLATTPLVCHAAIKEKVTKQSVLYLEAEYKDSVNSNGAPEKHLPIVAINSLDNSVQVQVPHVMDPEKPHFIEYIWLKDVTKNEVLGVKAFQPTDPSPPSITCENVKEGTVVKPLLFCNLHGLWQGEEVTV